MPPPQESPKPLLASSRTLKPSYIWRWGNYEECGVLAASSLSQHTMVLGMDLLGALDQQWRDPMGCTVDLVFGARILKIKV